MRNAVSLQQATDAAGVWLNTASRAIREDRYVYEEGVGASAVPAKPFRGK